MGKSIGQAIREQRDRLKKVIEKIATGKNNALPQLILQPVPTNNNQKK